MEKVKGFFKKAYGKISYFFKMIMEDQITVYAAQATFFIIVSAIPFIILLLGLAKYVIDIDWLLGLIDRYLEGDIGELITSVVNEVVDNTGAYLVSFTVITILWSASRGFAAVAKGISEAYRVRLKEIFLLDILRSFIYTVVFILIILSSLIVLVFAESIVQLASGHIPLLTYILKLVQNCGPIILTVLLSLLFAAAFNTVARKGKRFSKAEYKGLSHTLPRGFVAQVPGAVFAALGWVLFSYFFSLYLRYFPEASYIYGSLTTVMLLMLWVYACMFILMLGAEVNKLVFDKWNIGKLHKDYVKRKKFRRLEIKNAKKACCGRKADKEKDISEQNK